MTDQPTGPPEIPTPPPTTPPAPTPEVPTPAPQAETLPPPSAPALDGAAPAATVPPTTVPPITVPPTVPPKKGGLPGWAWLLIGGGVALIVIVIIIVVIAVGALRSVMDAPATPDPIGSAEPTAPAVEQSTAEFPEEITFAAGTELPSDMLPGFSTTLIADPEWAADPSDADPFDGSATYTHIASGCVLFTYQTYATDIVFDPADDYYNSELVLKSFFERDDIGQPGSYFFDANFATSRVEVAAIIVGMESGEAQLTTARGFGASNIALLTTFRCADQATAVDLFETVALPTIAVEFLPG